MRIVRYDSQERVDLPDITAMSYLVLGEFRRTVRGLLLGPHPSPGPDYETFVIRGFKVEPQAVPNATIRVRLDPGGTNPLGFALGGENLGARVDFGQLIGGDGSDGTLEGNATYTLDFTGQPVGVYTVQMRFVYSAGANDNRAFWDDAGNAEFIAATDTRTLPSVELRLSGAPSDEWIDLASVTWGGATINAGNIADLRVFALEGGPTFRQATQTGAGAIADFDRSVDRAAVGLNELYPFMRALARQVQDIKGQADDGQWDWFSRPFSPYDPGGALGAQTKTLRTIDTVTYTIGDGTTTFGDFNGAGGLDACLAHIVGLATKPERLEIVLHGGVTYTMNGGYFVNGGAQPMTMIIRAGQTLNTANAGLQGRPRISIDGATLAVSEYALVAGTTSNVSNLVLQDLEVLWTGTTAGGRGMFAAAGYVKARNCDLYMTTAPSSPAVDAGFAILASHAQRTEIDGCLIRGRVCVYDQGTGTGDKSTRQHGGVISNTVLEETQIMLHAETALVPGVDAAVGFRITDCTIAGRSNGAIYTGSVALIDARAASNLRVEGCTIAYGSNENALDGRTYSGEVPNDWTIRDCSFGTTVNNGTHVAGAGTGGANGTGWAINFEASTTCFYPKVDNCRFGITSTDAGAMRFFNARAPHVRDCSVLFSSHTAGGGDTVTALLLSATAANFKTHAVIDGLVVRDWSAAMSRSRGIRISNVDDVVVQGCDLRGDDFAAADISGRTNDDAALVLDDVENVRVRDCAFSRWNYGVATSACLYIAAGGTTERCSVQGCIFDSNGNYAIHWGGGGTSTQGPIILGNHVLGGASSNNLGITLTGAAGANWTVSNNIIRHNTGVGNDAIFFNNMGGGTCIGNDSNADIRKTGATLIRGYGPDDTFAGLNQNLNFVNAYT